LRTRRTPEAQQEGYPGPGRGVPARGVSVSCGW
jgi:hypothetical protein